MSAPVLAASLRANPRLSQWVTLSADGVFTVRTGKAELGQGIATVLAQMAADELDVALPCIRMVAPSTQDGPDEGLTAGSLSVQDSGAALRQACAEVRALFVEAAARQLGVAASQLVVEDGEIFGVDQAARTSYRALRDAVSLERDATGQTPPKPPAEHRLMGSSVARQDLPAKLAGEPVFIHDMALPGQLHGRMVRPPSRGARLLSLDRAAVSSLPGVRAVLHDGNLAGVVADDEYRAVLALEKLAAAAQWEEADTLPDMQALDDFLRMSPAQSQSQSHSQAVADKAPADAPAQDEKEAGASISASYSRPYLAHASIAPSCGVAVYTDDAVQVWSHSQGIFHLRADLALLLGLPAEKIAVSHVQGAGCYGHNGADDAAADAVLLARAVPGRPVRVLWSREDELGWAPFGAAMAVSLSARVDADGNINRWKHEVWSNGHSMRPGRGEVPALLVASQLAQPFEALTAVNPPPQVGGGGERNAVPIYNFAQWHVTSHRVLPMPLRTSSLRSLGAHCNVFAIESFMDEIAAGCGIDPLALRLRHLDDPRARDVLQAAADMAGWSTRAGPPTRPEGEGMGLAVARYKNTGAWCAVVAQIEAGRDVRVRRLWIAADVGRVVNPDGVMNQIEGGAVQTVSWTLKEAVTFDRRRVLGTTWEDYPILRFSEVPQVDVQLMHRSEEKSLGAGEATHGPVSAAIANAVADALGVRMRYLPLTADAITQAVLDS